ncbi:MULTISPECIES: hypothetical protein [unclassified Cryobacterium]|nr:MULTISPECIES: hypothetical protein [unclassified Cryobacterium]
MFNLVLPIALSNLFAMPAAFFIRRSVAAARLIEVHGLPNPVSIPGYP